MFFTYNLTGQLIEIMRSSSPSWRISHIERAKPMLMLMVRLLLMITMQLRRLYSDADYDGAEKRAAEMIGGSPEKTNKPPS